VDFPFKLASESFLGEKQNDHWRHGDQFKYNWCTPFKTRVLKSEESSEMIARILVKSHMSGRSRNQGVRNIVG
jgi:hypothetical protein